MKDIQNNHEIPIPEGLEERLSALIDRLEAEEKGRRRFRLSWRGIAGGSLVAAAACILLLLVFRFSQEPAAEEKPVIAEVIEQEQDTLQPAPQPVIGEMPHKAHKAHKPHKAYKPQAEPLLAEAEPMQLSEAMPSPSIEEQEDTLIPPDMQALADIFLAEEALQVAYELQAQREAIRAYAASLMGEELPKPIIAF